MNSELASMLDFVAGLSGNIVVLTGAGISAESGIPTFRGEEGFWTVGAREYHPQELATWQTFASDPALVWPWYLYRRSMCSKAQANAGHNALVRLEQAYAERFILVTQNVDGLHLRAGNSPDRCYEIHGNIDYMRCSEECRFGTTSIPSEFDDIARDSQFNSAWKQHLTCPRCGAWMRPHVLWFDETYDEPRYRFQSSIDAMEAADLFVVIGTSGATTLPVMMARVAAAHECPMIDINPQANPFSELADRMTDGFSIQAAAGEALPPVVDRLIAHQSF